MGWFGPDQQERNEDFQEEVAEKQYKYDKKVHKFTTKENERLYDHKKETIKIQKENDKQNIDYQNETAEQQHNYQVEAQNWEFTERLKAKAKSDHTADSQLEYNVMGLESALAEQGLIEEELMISNSFDNAALMQELYESTGAAGFQQVALDLGLDTTERMLGVEEEKQLMGLKHATKGSEMKRGDVQLGLLDAAGQVDHTKAGLALGLDAKGKQIEIQKALTGIGARDSEARSDAENTYLLKQVQAAGAKTAHDVQQRNIEALQAYGQFTAQGITGKSANGFITKNVFAEIGRQNTYLIDALFRQEGMAEVQARQNSEKALSDVQKAALAEAELDEGLLDAISKVDLEAAEAERGLNVAELKGQLDFDKINQEVLQLTEQTELATRDIEGQLAEAQKKAGLDTKKIDWDLDNLGTDYKHSQAVIKSQFDMAVEKQLIDRRQLIEQKYGADLKAEAYRMLDPTEKPDIPAPIEIEMLEYQDPIKPKKAPKPIKGAVMKADTSITAQGAIGATASGVGAGAAAVALGASGPVGWAIGGVVALSQLFG